MDNIDIEKLKAIINMPISYKKLCETLDMPYKANSTNSKTHQLNTISLYCDMEILDNPTRYVIKKVYDDAVPILGAVHGNNKFQDLFEAAMYQALLNNNNNPLYMSSMEMLTLFNEVNENFSYTCNEYYMKLLGGEYLKLNEMSQITYKILREWTRRRMSQMEARRIIIVRKGFRLYSKWNNAYIVTNVEMGSRREQICQEIYDRAAKYTLPKDWNGEWVQAWRWERFEKKIKDLTAEYFAGRYIDLKPTTIILPPREEYLREVLDKIYSETPELKEINQEVCRKIFATSQLNQYNEEDKNMLIDISIKDNPGISIKNKIIQKNKDED